MKHPGIAISRAGVATPRIDSVQRYGGIIPSTDEIVSQVLAGQEVAS